jgi:hypothetical protein
VSVWLLASSGNERCAEDGYETGRRKERVEINSHIDIMSLEDWIKRHGDVCKYVTCVVVWYASSV